MTTYVDASHNIRFSLHPEQWKPDLVKSAEGDVTGYQEVELAEPRGVLRQFCIDNNRGLWHPESCGNPISWKRETFAILRLNNKKVRGMIDVHRSAEAMGINVPYNPARDITYVGLTHKATGKRVLRINVHPTAGATSRESSPGNVDSSELSIWKDWSIGQYWLDVVSFAAAQMSLQDPGIQNRTGLWDAVTLGGDYNGALVNTDRWYYPGSMLPVLFEDDEQMRGIDHLQHAHGSDARAGRRWAVDANSDHQIHFVERTFVSVADFPRQF